MKDRRRGERPGQLRGQLARAAAHPADSLRGVAQQSPAIARYAACGQRMPTAPAPRSTAADRWHRSPARPAARAADPSRAPAGSPRRRRRPARGESCRPPRSGRWPSPRRSTSPTAGGCGPAACWRSLPIASSSSRRPPGLGHSPRPHVVVRSTSQFSRHIGWCILSGMSTSSIAERLELVEPTVDDPTELVDVEVDPSVGDPARSPRV